MLSSNDLPSFFHPSNPYAKAIPSFKEHIEILDEEPNSIILVNTFDALETDALRGINGYNLVGIGPLIPSAFLDGKDPSDTSFGGDLVKATKDQPCIIEWLNSKLESSVVYISFGSMSVLAKPQNEEIARALLDSGRPFLWVIRESREKEGEVGDLSRKEELEKQGMIVQWCSQVEVLSHPSVGCFLTHCGWNSTFESLVSGVPMVAFPQWSDQGTNAKLVQDLWKTGVKVRRNEAGIVESHEIRKCVELVMGGGERGEEMTRNAKKWKHLAREAAKDGTGSSDKNLKAFLLAIQHA